MNNFHFLFAAWMAVWVVFFAYEVSVARRIERLRNEVAALGERLKRG